MADSIRTHGAERPDDVAVEVIDGRSATFGELDRRSNQLANALVAAGIEPGQRVATIDKNSLSFFETTFALAKLGGVNVAVNWRLAPAEMLKLIDDAPAPGVLERKRDVEGKGVSVSI